MFRLNNEKIFVPGEKWLYFEIYTNPYLSDRIISEEIFDSVNILLQENVIAKWYFIRYNIPRYHLRIRFELKEYHPVDFVLEILNENLKQYSIAGLIYDVSINTYQREIEKYGNISIDNAENIFFADSEFIAGILKHDFINNGHYRWLFAIRSIHEFLNDFNLDDAAKKALLGKLNNAFGKEFYKGELQAKLISSKYRKFRYRISEILNDEADISADLKQKLGKRSERINHDVEKIEFLSQLNLLEKPIESLIVLFLHMSMNRIFPANQRFHEMILYDFLFRHYKSVLAKQKFNNK